MEPAQGPPPPGPLPPVEAPALESNESLDCAKLVPQDVRDALLAGWQVDEGGGQSPRVPNSPKLCDFIKGSPQNLLKVAFDCRHALSDGALRSLREALVERGGQEVSGLGRGAVERADERNTISQVTAWDDDTPCYVLVTWRGEGRDQAVELARRLVASTIPASLLP
jgi:hypothetical protein